MNVEEQKCLCGHEAIFHADHSDVGIGVYCVGDVDCKCINFKLDNLIYIEELAKKKGFL